MRPSPPASKLTLIRLFEDPRERGYDGGYDAVRRYARRWAKERGQATAAAYVPLSFAPGEAFQFDWSHEVVLLSGATVIVKVAHVRLCHSRMLFVRAYPRETQEMVFDAHDRAFVQFKGACGRGIYDNMKTAVETIFVGKDRLYNRRRCAATTSLNRWPARRLRAGRRGKSRTRLGSSASASSRRACGSKPTTR
jgi:transposase